MENIKKLETPEDFNLLNKHIDNIVNDKVYDCERDWTQEEIDLFVSQFQGFQEQQEEAIIDMNKLDPNYISLEDYKEKFYGFDDETLKYMVECENKKLEDARIPPLIVRNENVTLTDSLSNVIYNGEKSSSKAECNTDSESSIGGGVEEEKEKEEEEVSV